VCGRHVDECGRLSARYKCADCGLGRMVDNIGQMIEHGGPNFERWRRRVAASVGAAFPDDG
jgi:hypothetical protein